MRWIVDGVLLLILAVILATTIAAASGRAIRQTWSEVAGSLSTALTPR